MNYDKQESLKTDFLMTLPKLNINSINRLNLNLKEFSLDFHPKKSKVLTINFFKTLLTIDDTIHLVLKTHLYVEVMMNTIIKNSFLNPKKKCNYSFSKKVQLLLNLGKIDESLSNDLYLLNKLRNEYAHNLFYDISDFDFSKFSDLIDIYNLKDYKRKSAKRDLNLLLFKFAIICLFDKIIEEHKEIYHDNI